MKSSNNITLFIRRHYGFIVFMLAAGILLLSPDAKAWLLRQFMRTGFVDARIENKTPQQQAVDFAYCDTNSAVVHTASMRGKVVFVNFWASWCPPCRAEFPSVQKLYNEIKKDTSVAFLTINVDENSAIGRQYLLDNAYTIPFNKISGPIPDAVYTGTLPTTIILDKAGKIRYRHEGFAKYNTPEFIAQLKQLTKE